MKKILVTGANGQLGRSIAALKGLLPDFTFLDSDVDTLDLTDAAVTQAFIHELHPDYIINCAAYTAVDRAETDVKLCRLVNCDAVQNLGYAAHAVGARLLHISTDYVFDGTQCRPYVETDAVNPQSVYGRTKFAGEQGLIATCPSATIVRTSWLYSEYGNNFVNTILRLGRERECLSVVFDQVGTPTYAGDLVKALFSIVRQAEVGHYVPGIYHYSNEGLCSWYDFAVRIMQISGLRCGIRPVETKNYPTVAARPAYSVLNKTRIKTVYGLCIPHWEVSLRIFLARLKASVRSEWGQHTDEGENDLPI